MKINVARLVLLSLFLVIYFLLSGCYTARVVALEVRCGFGKDYVCSPQFGDDGMHMVCGCMSNKDLKGN